MSDTPTPDGNVPGNHYDKYGTRNPIARAMMNNFLATFHRLVDQSGATNVHEAGCGEGELSISLARRGLRVAGSDIEPSIVEVARTRATQAGVDCEFETRSLHDLDATAISAELLVCCEVLEHLERPAEALATLSDLDVEHYLFSVPREPLWRVLNLARGKYVADLGNTPGHLQHWSSRGFVELVGQHFDVVETRRPLPWTMLLCRRR